MITIYKHIPIPDLKYGRRYKYPFNEMEVGDSIYVPLDQNRVYAAAYMYGKRKGLKFRTQSLVTGGTMIWRIK